MRVTAGAFRTIQTVAGRNTKITSRNSFETCPESSPRCSRAASRAKAGYATTASGAARKLAGIVKSRSAYVRVDNAPAEIREAKLRSSTPEKLDTARYRNKGMPSRSNLLTAGWRKLKVK